MIREIRITGGAPGGEGVSGPSILQKKGKKKGPTTPHVPPLAPYDFPLTPSVPEWTRGLPEWARSREAPSPSLLDIIWGAIKQLFEPIELPVGTPERRWKLLAPIDLFSLISILAIRRPIPGKVSWFHRHLPLRVLTSIERFLKGRSYTEAEIAEIYMERFLKPLAREVPVERLPTYEQWLEEIGEFIEEFIRFVEYESGKMIPVTEYGEISEAVLSLALEFMKWKYLGGTPPPIPMWFLRRFR